MEQSAREIQAATNDLIINLNESSESQMKHQDIALNDITKMLKSSEPSFLSPECCIYNVLTELCKVNKITYTQGYINRAFLPW